MTSYCHDFYCRETRSEDVFETGVICGWVCVCERKIVGFCTGRTATGEVLVLAVLPTFECQGVGKQLLGKVVSDLQDKGANPAWLPADSNPAVRAHGFYRSLGWRRTGRMLENGDEMLEFLGTA